MDFIKCEECQKELSRKAKKCPKCGAITKYGKKSRIKLIILFVVIIMIFICDRTGILKSCDDGDSKKGNNCISKHFSDAQFEDVCNSGGLYAKDGHCYQKISDIRLGLTTRKYYCINGYLDKLSNKCVVETTYEAYYKFE